MSVYVKWHMCKRAVHDLTTVTWLDQWESRLLHAASRDMAAAARAHPSVRPRNGPFFRLKADGSLARLPPAPLPCWLLVLPL